MKVSKVSLYLLILASVCLLGGLFGETATGTPATHQLGMSAVMYGMSLLFDN